MEKSFTVDFQEKTIDIPYPCGIHFKTPSAITNNLNNTRSILIYQTWSTRLPFRKLLVNNCKNTTIDFQGVSCLHYESTSTTFDKQYSLLNSRKAVFCPQPNGDSPSRSQTWDSLLSGCIPVLFSKFNENPMPFHDKIRYDRFIIRINRNEIDGKFGVSHVEYLNEYYNNHLDKVFNMQIEIQRFVSIFQYSRYPVFPRLGGWSLQEAGEIDKDDDAFTMVLKDFTYKSIKSV